MAAGTAEQRLAFLKRSLSMNDEEEVESWTSEDHNGAYGSVLKLPMAGYRLASNGTLDNVGTRGGYWSSTVSGILANYLHFNSSNADMHSNYRAYGFSVRCLKD